MTMSTQNLAAGVNSANGLSNTSLKLDDFGDSGIEPGRNPGGDGHATAAYDANEVEEDMTREIISLLNVDLDSEALTAHSTISTTVKSSLTSQLAKQRVSPIAASRPLSMEVDSHIQEGCSLDYDSDLQESSTGPSVVPPKTAAEAEAPSWQTLSIANPGSTSSVDSDPDADQIDSDPQDSSAPISKIRTSQKRRTASSTRRSQWSGLMAKLHPAPKRRTTSHPTAQSNPQAQQPTSVI